MTCRCGRAWITGPNDEPICSGCRLRLADCKPLIGGACRADDPLANVLLNLHATLAWADALTRERRADEATLIELRRMLLRAFRLPKP